MPNFEHGKPALFQEIQKAEIKLGISFSEEFRDYLLTYGFASIDGHEFTGLGCIPYLNVVDVTLDEQKYNPNIPHSWYVIEETHIDGIIIWQDATGSIYQSKQLLSGIKIADSFESYIRKISSVL